MNKLNLLLIIMFLSLSCDKPDKFEKFIEEKLNLNKTQRSNQQYYIIDMKSCSGCLEINNKYLSQEIKRNLNLVFIGNMESGGFFDRSIYDSIGYNFFEIKESDFFSYGIYTHDPLFLKFDEKGNTYSYQNIKVNEISTLDNLLQNE